MSIRRSSRPVQEGPASVAVSSTTRPMRPLLAVGERETPVESNLLDYKTNVGDFQLLKAVDNCDLVFLNNGTPSRITRADQGYSVVDITLVSQESAANCVKKSPPLADLYRILAEYDKKLHKFQFTSLNFFEYIQSVDVTYPEYNGEHFHDSQLFRNIQAQMNVVVVCGYGVYATKLEYGTMTRIHDETSIFTAEAAAIKHALSLEQAFELYMPVKRSPQPIFNSRPIPPALPGGQRDAELGKSSGGSWEIRLIAKGESSSGPPPDQWAVANYLIANTFWLR
ncbi:hypothetical protein Trydic_g23357 [Trypoxylus dichotomus]